MTITNDIGLANTVITTVGLQTTLKEYTFISQYRVMPYDTLI